jgi:hypothetical protein
MAVDEAEKAPDWKDPDAQDRSFEIAKDQLDATVDWVKYVWSEFLKWFGFFCGLNVTALGALKFLEAAVQPYIALVLASLNSGGIITTIVIFYYTRKAFRDHEQAREKLMTFAPGKGADLVFASMPLVLGAWVSFAAFITFILFISIWISFALTPALNAIVQSKFYGWSGFGAIVAAILAATFVAANIFISTTLARSKLRSFCEWILFATLIGVVLILLVVISNALRP